MACVGMGPSGADGNRTHNLLDATEALSQLSYRPNWGPRMIPPWNRPGLPLGGHGPILPLPVLTLFCILIAIVSLVGGWLPLLVRPTHRRMQLAISFVGGVMAGVAVLDLLPESIEEGGAAWTMRWLLGGFLLLFLLERFLPAHCHDVVDCDHDAPPTCDHEHKLTWVGALIGLTIHSLLAGAALAAVWQAGGLAAATGVFVVILLHKPLDALTLTALMTAGGSPRPRLHLVNTLFAATVPLGVAFFMGTTAAASGPVIAAALAIAAGMFLCISLSDLLPELHFHGHDRVALTAALLLGIGAAWGLSHLHGDGTDHRSESTILPSNSP